MENKYKTHRIVEVVLLSICLAGLSAGNCRAQDYSQNFDTSITCSEYISGILTETKREAQDLAQGNHGKAAHAQRPNKTKRKSEQKNQARKPAGQSHRSEDKVKLVVGQIFAGGRLPACVRETVNITKDEFEQKLTELYQSAPSVKELIDNLDNLAVYIQSKSGYEEVAPFLSYRQIPFSVNDQEYSLILSPRDALSLLRGFVSGDCTNLVNEFERYAPDHLLAPGFLNFRVIRNSDNYWIGNVYTVVANTKKGAVLIIDALQLPWQGGIRWLYIKTLPVESLQDSKRISQAAIIALVGDYAAKVNLQEVWLAFTSNFYQLVDYYQNVIYADCPSKSLEQAKEYFSLIGIEDSTSVASFTWSMQTKRGVDGPLRQADKSHRRFIRIWPLEETEANRLHIAARMGDIAKLNGLIEEGAKVDRKDTSGNTALHYAARSGFENVVKFLIARDANVNARGEEGKTPLHHAAEHAHQRTAQLLTSEGADINAKDAAGDTPLNYAAGSESATKDIVKLLISEGAGVNAKNAAGDTPVHFAAGSRSAGKDIIELLISEGADINAKNKDGLTPLHYAAEHGRKDIGELLIARGADINAKNASGETPLHYAAENGHKDVAELLIAKGADINAKNNEGQAPVDVALSRNRNEVAKLLIAKGADVSLHVVARIGALAKVKSLIEKGADINAKDTSDRTPLHYAIEYGHKDFVELLIVNGADVNAKDKDGNAPGHVALRKNNSAILDLLIAKGANLASIHLSAYQGDLDKVRSFIEKGTDVDAKDDGNATPLHKAAIGGHKDVVELLIGNAANIHARDQWNYTPVHYAVWSWNTEVAELLIEKGADVQAKDRWGWTPLHYAVDGDNRDMAELLIAKGAEVNTKGMYGETPLQIAKEKGHTEIVELLRKHGSGSAVE